MQSTLLDAHTAAAELGYVSERSGRIRGTFWTHVAPLIGFRVGRLWKFPRHKLEAFKRGELT